MLAALRTAAGTVPAPQLNGNGYIYWWVYAELEEQVGGNWCATPGQWPFLYSAIVVPDKRGGGFSLCYECIYNGGGPAVALRSSDRDSGGTSGPNLGDSLPVLPVPPSLSSVTVSGPDQLNKNSSGQHTVAGTLSDGTPVNPSTVTWSISMFSISSAGLLTTGNVKHDTTVTVTASTTVAGVTQSGTHNVIVRKKTIKQPKPTVEVPTITPNGGTFSQSVQVTLADTTPGATIHYTTNGTAPTKKSTVYNGAFVLTNSATVQANALKRGATKSGIASASFAITP
jgi:hypothetical protein